MIKNQHHQMVQEQALNMCCQRGGCIVGFQHQNWWELEQRMRTQQRNSQLQSLCELKKREKNEIEDEQLTYMKLSRD